MAQEIAPIPNRHIARAGLDRLPAAVLRAGEKASWRFIEFFTANIRNPNTRAAYAHAVSEFFRWCENRRVLELHQIKPFIIAAYIEDLQSRAAKPTVKQHLAGIRMLFDWLVTGQVLEVNPAASVRGPKYSVKRGKTPVLTPDQARQFLDSIPTDSIVGLRDRALVALMCYTFARVSAATGMHVEDYYQNGKRWWFRLHEKGGKEHDVPAHHNAEAYMDEYLSAAGTGDEKKTPLFRSINNRRRLTERPMSRIDVWRMIKRRAVLAGIPLSTCCHTWRGTGITSYLKNGGTVENAQAIANHESPRTTKLYDRRSEDISLDEVERIGI